MEDCLYYLCGTAAVAVVTIIIYRRSTHSEKKREAGRDYPRDTVILHQFKRGPFAPSMSGFCLKLETYLKLAKIPYQNVFSYKAGPKGKIPWIEYNGEVFADSHFIMQHFNKTLDVDLNKSLTPEQRATARAFQKMVDEHTYWLPVLLRWKHYRKETAKTLTQLPALFVWVIMKRVEKNTFCQGVGRHSLEEVEELLAQDIKTVSDFLGDKNFMMGDEPTEVDCSVFGQLAQILWHSPDTCKGKQLLQGDDFKNVRAYMERMRDTVWPDWDDCMTHGFTKEASK